MKINFKRNILLQALGYKDFNTFFKNINNINNSILEAFCRLDLLDYNIFMSKADTFHLVNKNNKDIIYNYFPFIYGKYLFHACRIYTSYKILKNKEKIIILLKYNKNRDCLKDYDIKNTLRDINMLNTWISVENYLPIVGDYSVLVYFSNNESIEMVHVEDYFKDITAGLDENGNQLYTKWYKVQSVTHWMELPEPPIVTTNMDLTQKE